MAIDSVARSLAIIGVNGGEGGAVSSVNGKTGIVNLNYSDVGALSENTELFSGDYEDLTNKPTIHTYTAGEGIDITNDVISATGGGSGAVDSVNGKTGVVVLDYEDVGALSEDTELFSGDYNDLTNKPTIPVVPTNVSAFTNDAGYLTQHQDISGKQDTLIAGSNISIAADGKTISATDTTYTAGSGISIVNGVISLDVEQAQGNQF